MNNKNICRTVLLDHHHKPKLYEGFVNLDMTMPKPTNVTSSHQSKPMATSADIDENAQKCWVHMCHG